MKLFCRIGLHKWNWIIWRNPGSIFGHICRRCGLERMRA